MLILFLAGFSFPPRATAQVKEVRRVLIFDDYGSITSPGITAAHQQILAGLVKSPYQIEAYSENLEVTLFPDEVSQRHFREEYIRKYASRKPDLIVTVGPSSLRFMVESHQEAFPNTPIVFCGTTEPMLDGLKLDTRFTGSWFAIQPEKTLNVALQLQPATRHVVVVGGAGTWDREVEAEVKRGLHNYESKLDFTYLTDLTMSGLLERLRRLPANTIVLHTLMLQDSSGAKFVDAAQAVPMVASAANAPVFVLADVDVGTGAVGGDLVSWAAQGQATADMAVRILNGSRPQDIPIAKDNNVRLFDWRALQRWGLKTSALPPDSVVLNRPPSLWRVYRRYVVAVLLVLLAQAAAIVALLWQRAKRKKTEARLGETEGRFRLVATAAPVMIWMSGPDKLCNYFNEPWLEFTGRSLQQESGNGWAEGVHPEDLDRCLQTYIQAFDSRQAFEMEYRLRRHDSAYRWIFDRGVPRFNGDGSFAGYIGSSVDVTEHKQAEEALSSVSRRLIDAHEQERTWIARELHDDISQRMALLMVELEALTQDVLASQVQASRRMAEACKQVRGLAGDIQALSHRLHSSKLEYLGLVAAYNGFCQELSARQNVEIVFHSRDVPARLSAEISLCIFRVLQEALANALKHSGVRQFVVSLEATSDEIHLSVQDAGVGFNPEQAFEKAGLGLTSMRERLKLVEGRLAIDSKPQCGTTVHAYVPLRATMVQGAAL